MEKPPSPRSNKARRQGMAEGEENPVVHILSPWFFPRRDLPGDLSHLDQLCHVHRAVPAFIGPLAGGWGGVGDCIIPLLQVCAQPPGAGALDN